MAQDKRFTYREWQLTVVILVILTPESDSPSYDATVAAAAPLQHYQVDQVHQSWGLTT